MEDATDEVVKQSEQPTEDTEDARPLGLNPDHADKFCYTKGQIEFLDPDKVKIKKP